MLLSVARSQPASATELQPQASGSHLLSCLAGGLLLRASSAAPYPHRLIQRVAGVAARVLDMVWDPGGGGCARRALSRLLRFARGCPAPTPELQLGFALVLLKVAVASCSLLCNMSTGQAGGKWSIRSVRHFAHPAAKDTLGFLLAEGWRTMSSLASTASPAWSPPSCAQFGIVRPSRQCIGHEQSQPVPEARSGACGWVTGPQRADKAGVRYRCSLTQSGHGQTSQVLTRHTWTCCGRAVSPEAKATASRASNSSSLSIAPQKASEGLMTS